MDYSGKFLTSPPTLPMKFDVSCLLCEFWHCYLLLEAEELCFPFPYFWELTLALSSEKWWKKDLSSCCVLVICVCLSVVCIRPQLSLWELWAHQFC